MAARAMWKGVLRLADVSVPVKLYSALEDRGVHFRLLHRKDQSPVQQVMVNPTTGKPVPYEETLKAYSTSNHERVLLRAEEMDALQPPKSRDIAVTEFLPLNQLDHRWYERPYYLGPDGDDQSYSALAQALSGSNKMGIAHWTMRNKQYNGALTLYRGYPMLISLRHSRQVVSVADLQAPSGDPLSPKDLLMARQLIGMLEAEFDPEQFRDEYRERVIQMIAEKRQGKKIKKLKPRPAAAPTDINEALRASLLRARA